MSKLSTKAFNNVKHNILHLHFPNGNHISTIWGPGTYSDNYNTYLDHKDFQKIFTSFLASNTVEIMIDCPDKLNRKIYKKYNHDSDNQVIGHLNISQWLEIINLLAK